MEKTIHTAFLLCGLIGLLTGGICFSFAKGMLSLMNTKPELIDGAVLYLKIYAVGMPAMGIYNFGNGVMSASGDTRHPLMYLAFAGVINVMYAFYTGCTSFMGQNRGAGQRKRVLKSYFISLFYSFAIGAILGGLLFVFGRQFLSLFATEAAVVDVGMQRIRIMAFSYMISAFMDCTIAASRGLGKSVAPTVIVILGSCVFRIAWIYTVFAYFHTIPSLYLLYFFSWTITSVAEILYFVYTWRKMVREGQL